MNIYRVPFRISGYIEIEANDVDEAWEAAHDTALRDLADQPGVTADLELPEATE